MSRVAVGSAKTAVISVRLTPKEKFAVELLARRLRTNLAGALMASVERMLKDEAMGLHLAPEHGGRGVSAVDYVWSPFEHERFARVAQHFPELFSDEEGYIWSLIEREPKYWKTVRVKEGGATKGVSVIDLEVLEEDWTALKKRAGIAS